MTQPSDNPLLSRAFHIPFDRIEASDIEPAVDHLLTEAKSAIDAIATGTGQPTYANTLDALEDSTEGLERAMSIVGHLEGVRTTDALREAYNSVRPKVSEFYSSIALNSALYGRLLAFSKTEEAKALEGEQERLLDKTLREFRRHGADLPEEEKERLSKLDVELSKHTTAFAQNLLDETKAYDLVIEDAAGLSGLPESAIKAAEQAAAEKGVSGYRFTLQAPSLIAVLTYLDDRDIREKMWRAYNRRASEGERSNRPVIARILELRREKAELLGYANFADFVLEERMAKKGEQARSFVVDLQARTQAAFDAEKEELRSFRREVEGADAGDLEPWDVGYYSEKLRKARFDLDSEELRPYFSADQVLNGLFEVAQRLYGVRIEARNNVPLWHEDVRYFELLDENDVPLGAFYVDLHPREDKRGGAWMSSFITGGAKIEGEPEKRTPHLGLFCANVTRPVGDEKALLLHGEVETLFHEFGHLMHHCLSKVQVRSLAGTAVAWDFVELPSQIMENWCWEREALDLFAHHVENGETIPEPLFAKMQRARTFRSASAMMRQLGFASADLALHMDYDPDEDGDAIVYARAQMEPFQNAPTPADYAMICGFTHLFASPVGYAAGYYSYKWAEVLEADAFTRFKEEGVFNQETGKALRDAILSRGDADEPEALFEAFMGREPSVEALLVRSGLSENQSRASQT